MRAILNAINNNRATVIKYDRNALISVKPTRREDRPLYRD